MADQKQDTKTAKARYEQLESKRSAVLTRARKAAELTIPGILPPQGASDQTPLPTPYQSLGARGVNNVSSMLLITLFPPDAPFFKLDIDPKARDQLEQANDSSLADVEAALAKLEQRARTKFEMANHRAVMAEAIRHLVVTGNGLLDVRKTGSKFFAIDKYVIRRNRAGLPLEAIIKECVAVSSLSDDVKALAKVEKSGKDEVDIFTHITWDHNAKRVTWHQEVNGVAIPDTNANTKIGDCPWIPIRWQSVSGENYGRSLVMEYLGDLISLEEIARAIVSFAAVAAKIIFLVAPNSSTALDALNKANSGDFVSGKRDDIHTLQLEKYADFKVADNVAERLELRLSHAFLLKSGTVRHAERVTAEEIRQMATELENVFGGTYTVLARDFQLPLVKRQIGMMKKAGEWPALPNGTVNPVVITGFQALGRTHAIERVRAAISDAINTLGQEALMYVKAGDLLKRLFVGHGVENPNELLRTDAEVEQMQQAQQVNDTLSKAAPGVAQEVTKASVGNNNS